MSKYIGVYEMFRNYGGPEEGGWWYDAGTLVRVESIPEGSTRAYVRALCADLEDEWVNGEAIEFDYAPPQYYPEETPRWE